MVMLHGRIIVHKMTMAASLLQSVDVCLHITQVIDCMVAKVMSNATGSNVS